MSRTRVYIKPFDETGEYLSEFIEITEDILKLGKISLSLDNTEYDVGVFRNSNFKITLRNDHGKYLEAGNLKSVFKTKRLDTQVKVTWDRRNYDLICGFFSPGVEQLGNETTVFEGLLTDVSSSSSILDQEISFTVLGFESLLDRTEFPYASISNGDNVSDIIYDALNQSKITDLLTVSASNINVGVDTAIDDKSDLENQTVKESLKDLLFISNSVLYIKNRTIYVQSRAAGASVAHTFYGPASISGIENVVNIKNYRDGINRLKNYWTWEDASVKSTDTDSIDTYGVQKKQVSSNLVSAASTAKITSILDSLKNEFSDLKTEMDLEAPIESDTLSLFLLDKVSIDYPTVFYPADDNPLPRYGQNVYGDARYPYGQWSLTVSSDEEFKNTSLELNPTDDLVSFKLRRV